MLPGGQGPGDGAQPGASPFYAPQQGQPMGGPAGGSGQLNPALLQQYMSGGAPSGSGGFAGFNLSLQDQQALASGPMPPFMDLPIGGGGYPALPVVPPSALSPAQLAAMQAQISQLQGFPAMPMPQQAAQHSSAAAAAAAAAKASKTRQKRPYKPPDVVQAERKQKAEVQEHIRKLEQQLGRARKELEHLQEENKVLHRKSVVLTKHSSFRRSAAIMAEELMELQSLTMSVTGMDWCQSGSRQALESAQRGLPPPEVLEQLRGMSVEEAVAHYSSVVSKVRELLAQIESGPDRAAAGKQLEEMFAMGQSTSVFGYLQVVNPPVYAQLMDTKLDPESPVERSDPSHWRAVLSSMLLTEEQEAQLILLLQSHLQQSEAVVTQKSRVMSQLAEELSAGLLTLELSGSSEILEGSSGSGSAAAAAAEGGAEGSGSAAGAAGGTAEEGSSGEAPPEFDRTLSGQPSSPGPLQAKDELDRLIQLEYWLKFDFTGCVRKLLPAQQQALCMVSSWPFYPDQRQLEAAIKDKAGQLWDQLQRTSASS